jgi:hypothetical protein
MSKVILTPEKTSGSRISPPPPNQIIPYSWNDTEKTL